MQGKRIITRRQALITGFSAMGAAMMLPGCTKPLPPTYGSILRMGDNLTYVAHRALLPGQSLAREYRHADISSFPATGTTNPSLVSEDYAKLRSNSFDDYRLEISGKVSNPGNYSLKELMSLSSRTQITKHTCEEGWTAIAEWTGVPLSVLLQQAGILPSARFIVFHSFDNWTDSIDLIDALHPQTIVAYGMNGSTLPVQHGAPVRLRLETQIGYKSIKYIKKIEASDVFVDYGQDTGWAWYTGI
jgi:DMSO/TMAO reductase YedYZ molybdopterin-dependent catalytic subunit